MVASTSGLLGSRTSGSPSESRSWFSCEALDQNGAILDAMLAEVGHLRTPKIPTPISTPSAVLSALRHEAPRPRHLLLYPLPLAENPHVRSGGTTDRHLPESCDIFWMESRKWTKTLNFGQSSKCSMSESALRSTVSCDRGIAHVSPLFETHSRP